MKYLNKAIKNNKVIEFKHIKILLTGSSAAGKSSFCRLLFGLKFSAKHNSTDVMENKQALSVVKSDSGDEGQGVIVKNLSMLKKGEEVVWFELDLKHQLKYFKTLLLSERFQDKNMLPASYNNNENDHDNTGDADDGNDDIDDIDDIAPQTGIKKEIMVAESLPDSFTIETVKLITVVDTGGQPEYIHLLPALNNHPTITFFVHDLTKKLDEPVQVHYKKEGCEEAPVRMLNYSNLDMIHLLMCFVTDSLEQPSRQTVPCISFPKKSYIGFVGTHYDKVKDDQKIVGSINNKLNDLIVERNFEHTAVIPTKKGHLIYLVDNTTAGDSEKEDPEVKEIRNQIEHRISQIETTTLPITWMVLQLYIQELCTTHHRRYITYEEYLNVARENTSLYEEDEIKASLTYFHFIGILQYLQDAPSLNGCIVINLQWLYTSLAKVMHLLPEDITFHDVNFQQKFNDHRLLANHSDCKVQLKDINNDKNISEDELQYFLKLLVHLKIIAIVKIDSIEYYYLPCMLSNLKVCDDKHKHLLSEPLLIQFTSGFLPRGFFCSLVVHLLERKPDRWNHQLDKSKQNFSDLIIFNLPDGSYLYMYDKIFYLKAEVRHGRKNFKATYHSEILNVLQYYFKKVCNQLNFDEQKLQYGFLCLTDKSNDDHIAVLNLARISKSKIIKLTCSQKDCDYKTSLNKSHKVWFKEVSILIIVMYLRKVATYVDT